MINTKKIAREDILLGVFCPACGFRGLIGTDKNGYVQSVG